MAFASCKKEVIDSEIRVTIKDSSGASVQGATVKLYGQPSDSVFVDRLSLYDLDEVTNDDGIAIFNFNDFYDQGDNGFAILTLEVIDDSSVYTDLVKIVEGEIIEKAVIIP